MNKKLVAVAVAAGLALPMVSAHAGDDADKKFEVYGKIHVNVGQYDSLTAADKKAKIESFDSRIGFKGAIPLTNSLTGTYQIETKVVADGDSSNFADRTTFVGLKGGFGEVRVGYHDSPLKLAQGKFDQFGDTKGDFKNAGDQSGEHRNTNTLTYLGKFDKIGVNVQLIPSEGNGTTSGQTFTDSTSVSVTYSDGPLYVAVAQDTYDNKSSADKNSLTRLVATYDMGAMQFGLLSQSGVQAAAAKSEEEKWLGASFAMKMGDNKLKAQVINVEDSATTKTKGTQTSFGIDHKLGKNGTLYAMYTKVKETGVAKDDSSASVGYILKF